jgi:hypothetical protein
MRFGQNDLSFAWCPAKFKKFSRGRLGKSQTHGLEGEVFLRHIRTVEYNAWSGLMPHEFDNTNGASSTEIGVTQNRSQVFLYQISLSQFTLKSIAEKSIFTMDKCRKRSANVESFSQRLQAGRGASMIVSR